MIQKLKESSSIEKGEEEQERNKFFWIIYDFKYLMKKNTIEAMLKNRVVEELIDHFRKI